MDIHAAFRRRSAELLARLAGRGDMPPDLACSVTPPRGATDCDLVIAVVPVCGGPAPAEIARRLAGEMEREPEVAAVVPAGRGALQVTLSADARAAGLAALLRGNLGRRAEPAPGTLFGGVIARCRDPDPPFAEARAAALADVLAALDAAGGEGTARPVDRGRVGPVSVLPGRDGAARGGGLRSALDAVGPEALRFALAAARPGAPLGLDLDRLAERSRDNPLFWISYAHARASRMLRHDAAAESVSARDLPPSALARLDRPHEVAAARTVLRHEGVVARCAGIRSAHPLAAHLFRLAVLAHELWAAGKDQPQLRFVNEEQRESAEARFGLVTACTLLLASGLGLFGVSAPFETP